MEFVAQTIIVDNWSTVYLYLPDAGRWAAPQAVQQIFPVNSVKQKNIVFSAPSGIAQPADNGGAITVTWLEEAVTYAPISR